MQSLDFARRHSKIASELLLPRDIVQLILAYVGHTMYPAYITNDFMCATTKYVFTRHVRDNRFVLYCNHKPTKLAFKEGFYVEYVKGSWILIRFYKQYRLCNFHTGKMHYLPRYTSIAIHNEALFCSKGDEPHFESFGDCLLQKHKGKVWIHNDPFPPTKCNALYRFQGIIYIIRDHDVKDEHGNVLWSSNHPLIAQYALGPNLLLQTQREDFALDLRDGALRLLQTMHRFYKTGDCLYFKGINGVTVFH